MRAALPGLSVLILTGLFAAGCGSLNRIDLRLKAIDVTTRAEQPLPDDRGDWDALPGRMVRVVLRANANLRAAKNEQDLHVHFDAWFCSYEEQTLSYLPILYDDRGVLGESQTPAAADSNDVWLYLAEIARDRRDIDVEKRKLVPGYELASDKRDVCLQVRGRNMVLQGFTSNVVRVPAELIADKLR